MVHHRGDRGLAQAMPLLAGAIEIGDAALATGPLVVDYIGDSTGDDTRQEKR
jgi:hypothetical protein